ncbi:MAG: hypothetical protein QOI10_883 [Solirubrobacterales bacterium]|nr:hypothetical protein [Solirubrobacterales bacterium]
MALDAAKRFHELVVAGDEIPYEVREPGDGSPLCEYEPQTARFVRDHAPALRELDSFGAACAALEAADLAGPYLEAAAIPVPAEGRRRSELASVVFLARLWEDSTDFSLPEDRLEASLLELQVGGEPAEDEIEVVVQLRGLQMPVERLELATATIIRADAVDVPAEARASDGSGAAGWQPTFLAVARVGDTVGAGEAPDAGARAVGAFRALITTLRLFKAGGVGLGPHAWARTGSDRWRRIATGEGRPRPGGYVVAEEELGELVALSRALANRSTPFGRPAKGRPGFAGALARAISRFELGLERAAALEALNDYLLALRFVLEGGGPADLGLPMRVAALCSEPEHRGETKAVIERAMSLERELWTGEPAARGEGAPAEVTVRVEELARAIFKDAACGHLGGDLRATADEILLADGLSIGEGAVEQRGETAEWESSEEEEHEWAAEEEPVVDQDEHEWADEDEPVGPADEPVETVWAEDVSVDGWSDEPVEPEPTLAEELRQVTQGRGRIRVEQNFESEEEQVIGSMHASEAAQRVLRERPVTTIGGGEPVEQNPVAEAIQRHEDDRRDVSDRVAFLFPRPETCQWEIREVGYDRTQRAGR